MRPGTPAGRRITHHALAFLQQEEPGTNTGPVTQGLLMEWAVNKNYDIYRPNTGKLLRDRAFGGRCTTMRWARKFAMTWSWRFTFIPRDRSPSIALFSRCSQARH